MHSVIECPLAAGISESANMGGCFAAYRGRDSYYQFLIVCSYILPSFRKRLLSREEVHFFLNSEVSP